MQFASAANIRRQVARMAYPPPPTTVVDSATKHLRILSPSGSPISYDPNVNPLMRQPINDLISRDYDAVIIIGPARNSKTVSVLACVAHIIKIERADATIYHNTKDKAIKFSRKELADMYRHSPGLKAELTGRARDDNILEKFHLAGNRLAMAWPTDSQMAGDTLRFCFIPDYDRIQREDGRGSIFNRVHKRSETFLSRRCTFAETSPGYEQKDPNWHATGIHEMPPTDGLSIQYNLGTRNRVYWKCPHCGEYAQEPRDYDGFKFHHARDLLGTTDPMQMGDVGVICSECGTSTDHRQAKQLLKHGRWVPEGCTIDCDGQIHGQRRNTRISSYWQSGGSAAYQSIDAMIRARLEAEERFDKSGDEDGLRDGCYMDMALPFLSRRRKAQTDHTSLMSRAEPLPRGQVPEQVRFLLAMVDVQGGKDRRFIVQIIGYGVGLESWIIDRYSIRWIGEGEDRRRIRPEASEDDWNELERLIMRKPYPLQGQPDKGLMVHRLGPDSGGEGNVDDGGEDGGVTDKAYKFWRRMRRERQAHRVHLIKGSSNQAAPRVAETFPDNKNRKDRRSSARGDVPVLMTNTNRLKDIVNGDIALDAPEPGYMHWPDWLKESFFRELTVESRKNGRWENPSHARNETFVLYAYGRGLCSWLGADNMNWDNPKPWAKPLDAGNSNVVAMSEHGEEAPALRPPIKRKRRQSAGNIASSDWLL